MTTKEDWRSLAESFERASADFPHLGAMYCAPENSYSYEDFPGLAINLANKHRPSDEAVRLFESLALRAARFAGLGGKDAWVDAIQIGRAHV